MGPSERPDRTWQSLLEPAYLAGRWRLIRTDRILPSSPDGGFIPDGSTTHPSVVDRDRNMVSTSQTLLSGFGSKVTIPGSGVRMNNGMLWFDPEPGRPNSVAGGKRPLSNMAPVLLFRGGRPLAAFGSSGGRRIIGTNTQIAMAILDHGLTMQAAIEAPRIDLSSGKLLADLGHSVTVGTDSIFPRYFASACGILIDPDIDLLRGGADPFHVATCMGY